MKTKKGIKVLHNDKIWIVEKILIPGKRVNSSCKTPTRDYIYAYPVIGSQILKRNGKNIGQEWCNI